MTSIQKHKASETKPQAGERYRIPPHIMETCRPDYLQDLKVMQASYKKMYDTMLPLIGYQQTSK